jgi:hypothetical protein
MLKSLWRRPSPSGAAAREEQALALYFRDEGLHAELEALSARRAAAQPGFERALHGAHWYFAA